MKTFVKIPVSDWSSTQFEVPVVQGNLHSRVMKRLTCPPATAPKVPVEKDCHYEH
jgi:hypothetical protein